MFPSCALQSLHLLIVTNSCVFEAYPSRVRIHVSEKLEQSIFTWFLPHGTTTLVCNPVRWCGPIPLFYLKSSRYWESVPVSTSMVWETIFRTNILNWGQCNHAEINLQVRFSGRSHGWEPKPKRPSFLQTLLRVNTNGNPSPLSGPSSSPVGQLPTFLCNVCIRKNSPPRAQGGLGGRRPCGVVYCCVPIYQWSCMCISAKNTCRYNTDMKLYYELIHLVCMWKIHWHADMHVDMFTIHASRICTMHMTYAHC